MKAMGESVNALKHNTHSGGQNRGNTNQQGLKPNQSGGESRSRCYKCKRAGQFSRDYKLRVIQIVGFCLFVFFFLALIFVDVGCLS